MKLLGETRFDVSDEDAKEHGLPDDERYGLAIVFACKPEERVALKEFAEQVSATQGTHVLIRADEVAEPKALVDEARKERDAAYAANGGASFFDILGVRFRKYNMESRRDSFDYDGARQKTAFRDIGTIVNIEVETLDQYSLEMLVSGLQRMGGR